MVRLSPRPLPFVPPETWSFSKAAQVSWNEAADAVDAVEGVDLQSDKGKNEAEKLND